MKKRNRIIALLLSICLILGCFMESPFQSSNQVSAATIKVKYTYNGKNKTYSGKSRKIIYNGKTVSLSNTPVMVFSKYVMAPYYETFVKGTVKVKKSYSSKTKKLTLTGNGHTLVMKVGSKTATIDGKKTNLGAAPRTITYRSSKKKRIMVPVKTVAKALGLQYTYSSRTGIVKLTTSSSDSTSTEETTTATTATTTATTDSSETTTAQTDTTTVSRTGELKAMWISYLEFEAYLDTYKSSKANFTKFIDHMYDTCVANNMNAVIVHVRPFGDAIYKSSYFPWSKYISGKQGSSPGFDPLTIMVQEAHERNLEFHAWLNPYRVSFNTSYSSLSSDNPARKWHNSSSTSRNVLSYGGKLYYNPSKSQVQTLIINGVKEIVKKYDVDGIHFDDYFYPSFSSSNVKTAFDAKEYNSYKASQIAAGKSYKSIYNWRRANVNKLVSGVYSAIKAIDKNVEFGISPAGNIDNLKSNYSYYVDIDTWLNNTGYIDYIMPQIYWGFTHKTAAFDDVLDRWVKLNKKGIVDLHVGIGVYKVGMAKSSAYSDWKEWQQDTTLLKDMIAYGRKKDVDGFAFFSYEYFDTSGSIKFSSKSFSSTRKTRLKNTIKKLVTALK
ncbi:MAG: family 10 glycosylhydrolase [Lachnospiraceae bacterium]|nr:family 10 glycosylhydrolase [Lachnospiraceae bacterium]